MTNNTALFDAALGAIGDSNGAWLTDPIAADYAPMANAAVAIATEIDAQIPAILTGATISQRDLLASIVKNVMAGRSPSNTDPSSYTSIAAAVAGMFTEFSTSLQNPDVGNNVSHYPPADVGQVLTVQADGSVEPEPIPDPSYPTSDATKVLTVQSDGSVSPEYPIVIQSPNGADVVLSTDNSTEIYRHTISGLTNSKRYVYTFHSTITINSNSTSAHFGSTDITWTVQAIVSNLGVVTLQIGNTPVQQDHFSAGWFPTVSVGIDGDDIVVYAQRPTGEPATASCEFCRDANFTEGDAVFTRLVAVSYGQVTTAISSDGGASWINGGNLGNSGWAGVTFDYDHNVFVTISYNNTCPVASSSDGTVWSTVGAAGGTQGTGIVFDRINHRLVCCRSGYVATSKSTDGGVNWTAAGNLSSVAVWEFMVVSTTTNAIHAFANASTKHDISTNGGDTWAASTPMPAALGWTAGVYIPALHRFVFIAGTTDVTYYSDDECATFHLGGTLSSAALNWTSLTITNDGSLVAGAYNSTVTNRSTDGGLTWTVDAAMPSAAHWQAFGAS